MPDQHKLLVLIPLTDSMYESLDGEGLARVVDPRIEGAAGMRGVPDMTSVEWAIRREGVLELGTDDDPYKVNLAEKGLVVVEASVWVTPNETERAALEGN